MQGRVPVSNVDEAVADLRANDPARTLARFNAQNLRVVRVLGARAWHRHEADELFFVRRGNLRLEFRDRVLDLRAGDAVVVPRGTEHRTLAADVVDLLLVEPDGAGGAADADHHIYTDSQPTAGS